MHHIISFSEIPEQGIHLEINDTDWFPDEHVCDSGVTTAHLFLAKKGESKIEVHGELKTDVLLVCDRCLENFKYRINAPFQLIFEVNDPDHHWRVQDIQGTEADIDTVVLDSPKINIGELLREQLYLALPEKSLCRQSCAGLCSQCGVNKNFESCSCHRGAKNSPFAVLGQLQKKK